MESWDMSMQMECAKSLHKENVLSMMTPGNHIRLMDECLNIVLNADTNTQEEVRR